MVSYLDLTRDALPKAAGRALEVARRFVADQASDDDLDAAAVDCWKHLESSGATYDFSNQENLAFRAVLCTLVRSSSAHAPQLTVEYFLSFADGVEDHSLEIDRLLRKHFL
jgi:hypothetical protein